MRIALVGCGGVGRAFLKLMGEKGATSREKDLNIQVNYIIDVDGGIYSPEGVDCRKLHEFLERGGRVADYPAGGSYDINLERGLSQGDMDVMVELTPTNKDTGEPGLTHIRKALDRGTHVVTGNKGPILLAYRELNELAARRGVQLGIGCTTGGALPSINAGLIDMAGAEIESIEGILNGSTNFILKEMEERGVEYGEALKRAQELGIAETDPRLDVEGWDTASKLLILTNVLMAGDKTLEDIGVEGITGLTPEDIAAAREEGSRYKLIGRSQVIEGKVVMSVEAEKVGVEHTLYGVEGKNKAVRYTSSTLGDLTVIGGASGTIPAAASIYRDIVNIARGYRFSQ
ncbi:homoserine dehydrogenase [Propionigenium maris DSM 9537]|uniref:Homoserine dehydrogenase n=1 Tax=Propionigenium maris DSM 9537 TaxID=1123000 RepID=A0A9W6GJF8_9FUSO|nr:hypothetical protein [Propionigenium maris]GLI54956.1 homoserine dehydrogenase [Propionigenium maris DSM 9537]